MARITRRGGVYYYRARVPKDLQEKLRRVELKFSLNCTDRQTAEELALEMSAGQLRLCRALRQAGRMTADRVDQLIAHYMTSYRTNREDDALSLGSRSPEAATERRQWITADLAEAEDDLLHNRMEATERLAGELLREAGLPFADLGEDAFRRLCFRLLSARVDVMRGEAQRLPSAPPPPTFVAPPVPDSPRLSALIADYLAHRDASEPLSRNSRLEAQAAFRVLVDLMGDPQIAGVRNRDAQDFARRFSQLPKRWRTTPAYRGKTATAVLVETEGLDVPRIDPATVKKEMALIKAFWRWAAIREELPRNVMDAVKPPDIGNAKDKRKPFTDADMQTLRPVIEAQLKKRPERYWVTLLVAYSGARLGEIAQLRKQDVCETDGIWCIRIRAEAGSVKTEASERDLPVHSEVLRRGFVAYVESAEGARLFEEDTRKGKSGAPISKWFANELRKLELPDGAKKGMHSFRHTMRDKLRLAGVDPVTRREILGHAHEDVEDQVYGDPTSLQERHAALGRVSLPL